MSLGLMLARRVLLCPMSLRPMSQRLMLSRLMVPRVMPLSRFGRFQGKNRAKTRRELEEERERNP